MITLNDYLYSGDTIFKVLQNYITDLREDARKTKNEIDLIHCNFLIQIRELLEHNEFLTTQSQQVREFYKYMTKEYPYLAFTVKGRIKSLIRAEEKFNGYIVKYISDYHEKYGTYPTTAELKSSLSCFRDLIAYRIVISMPKCHYENEEERQIAELECLYGIANVLPGFLEERGFTAEPANGVMESHSPLMDDNVRPYYRDYISDSQPDEYQSLHITFYDNCSRSYIEVQIPYKANGLILQRLGRQTIWDMRKNKRKSAPEEMRFQEVSAIYFDEAYERGMRLQKLELSKLDVNMFAAVNNSLINDGCGLYRGRLILPYEHLSRFQNDLID